MKTKNKVKKKDTKKKGRCKERKKEGKKIVTKKDMKKKQRKKRKRYKEETKKGIYKLRSDQIDRKMFEHLNRIFIQGHGPVFEKGISLTKKIKQKILTELISCNSY